MFSYKWNSVKLKLTEEGRYVYKAFYNRNYNISVKVSEIMTMSETKMNLIFRNNKSLFSVLDSNVFKTRLNS